MRGFRIIAIFTILVSIFAVSQSLAAKRVAVLIGCNEYDGTIAPPLTGCIADVNALAKALKKQQYQVWTMTDDAIDPETEKPNIARYYPQKINIERQLPIWIPAGGFEKGDTVLFFFSGHGVRMSDGNDYLVPLGFQKVEPSELVGLSRVYEIMRKSGAENIVIITDACRNIPGKSLGGMEESRGFGVKSLEKSIDSGEQKYAFLRSCAEDQKSYERPDGGGGNYAYYLVKGLDGDADGSGSNGKKDGIINIGELYAYAKDNVMSEAQKKNQIQIPQYERKGDDPDSITVGDNEKQKAITESPSTDQKAYVNVSSAPSGSHVQVTVGLTTLAEGTTPCNLELDLGSDESAYVSVSITKDGYKEKVLDNVDVRVGATANLSATLSRLPSGTGYTLNSSSATNNAGTTNSNPQTGVVNTAKFIPYKFTEPLRTATRYDLALAIGKTFGLESDHTFFIPYKDVQENHYAAKAIAELTRVGILLGSSNDLFKGNSTLTRYEFASIIHRLVVILPRMMQIPAPDLSVENQFSDVPASHWASGDVKQIGKLISGNKFNGDLFVTRKDVTGFLTKIVKSLQPAD